MILGLMTGQVDAIVLDEAIANNINSNNTSLALLGNKIQVGLGYGIVALTTNEGLIFNMNKALLNMEADGTYLSIYNTYFGFGAI